ncbi:YibE/F family protein [Nocardioides sp. KIGAM211]|uniref:YibE/F family protein n=1 Tax=Nocardioides luti TaxID=2761101 RepID=A0A7X0RH06_9ACTN|nr:YibE/F family protein [Nocardioides luti]MBB6628037.1 YibE/F family protein [Nocardioides luti]
MGHGHSHRAHRHDEDDVEVARVPRVVLLAVLGLLAATTVGGLVWLWPDGGKVDDVRRSVEFAAPGVTFPDAVVRKVAPVCTTAPGPGAGSGECNALEVEVTSGPDRGARATVQVAPQVLASGLEPGDGVRLLAPPAAAPDQPVAYSYFGTERSGALWWLLGAFVLVVVAVARLRGVLAIVGLAFSGVVIWQFVLPALLAGESALLVGLVASAAIMYVVLYTTHGFSMRTSAALAGTLAGVAITAATGLLAVGGTHLTGAGDESGSVLSSFTGGLDFQGLLTCAIVIAGLGVLNDVTITQASAVWELRGAAPTLTRAQLFARGMRIGRDHIASTIYTIVFAYAGTALTVLLVIQLYDQPLLDLLVTEDIGQEVVRALASSIGLVLAVPLTTVIATLTVPGPRRDDDVF